jgi:hypothetical protein
MLRKRQADSDLSAILTEEGELGRPVDATLWTRQLGVEIRDDRLYYDPSRGAEVGPSRAMFPAFIRLAGAPAAQIADFARSYGVLRICEHGLPCSHNPDSHPSIGGRGCAPLGWHERRSMMPTYDPVQIWRAFAREAFALTKIADRLLQGHTGHAEDWATTFSRSGRKAPWWHQHVDVERIIVARTANEWLTIGNVRPVVVWHGSEKKPTVKLGGDGLFGALALQLALAIGQSLGFAVCVHCRKEYPPTARRPKAGQRNFCPECRAQGIPSRYSLTDYRERVRKGD